MGNGMLPYLYDEEYSQILLGTTPSPGKCVLSNLSRDPEWDNQKAKGSTGASSSLKDPNPIGTFTATFYLADDTLIPGTNNFDRWEDFQSLIESTTSGVKPFALPIYHPDLARLKYTEVVNAGIGGFIHDGQGGVSVAVKFQEYRPAKPKASAKPTAKASGKTPGKASKPDPNAKAKAELAGLLAQAKAA